MYQAAALLPRISVTNTQRRKGHHSHFKSINKAPGTHLPKVTRYNWGYSLELSLSAPREEEKGKPSVFLCHCGAVDRYSAHLNRKSWENHITFLRSASSFVKLLVPSTLPQSQIHRQRSTSALYERVISKLDSSKVVPQKWNHVGSYKRHL